MKKLTTEQLDQLQRLLIRNGSNDALAGELLDHLACEVEGFLWKGYNFDLAAEKVSEVANKKAIEYLRETYKHECAMTDGQLKNATLDDIIFEFRNKEYGAYDLRQAYPKALKMGFLGGIGIFFMLIAGWAGFTEKTWNLFSFNGIIWTLGVAMVAYACWAWYTANHQKHRRAI